DGDSRKVDWVAALAEEYTLIPVCPEVDGGLPTPRPRAERRGEQVVTEGGADVTAAYRRGGELAVEQALKSRCKGAILKAKSPSCGKGLIYDGSFSGTLIPGDGVTAALLKEAGIPVFTEEEQEAFFTFLDTFQF
ncbi:MAG: DUF523 domain-containing protein, partial [Clostridia bacterium]|nr:DUF523 domain-containing protein [Clostridia bacterium]